MPAILELADERLGIFEDRKNRDLEKTTPQEFTTSSEPRGFFSKLFARVGAYFENAEELSQLFSDLVMGRARYDSFRSFGAQAQRFARSHYTGRLVTERRRGVALELLWALTRDPQLDLVRKILGQKRGRDIPGKRATLKTLTGLTAPGFKGEREEILSLLAPEIIALVSEDDSRLVSLAVEALELRSCLDFRTAMAVFRAFKRIGIERDALRLCHILLSFGTPSDTEEHTYAAVLKELSSDIEIGPGGICAQFLLAELEAHIDFPALVYFMNYCTRFRDDGARDTLARIITRRGVPALRSFLAGLLGYSGDNLLSSLATSLAHLNVSGLGEAGVETLCAYFVEKEKRPELITAAIRAASSGDIVPFQRQEAFENALKSADEDVVVASFFAVVKFEKPEDSHAALVADKLSSESDRLRLAAVNALSRLATRLPGSRKQVIADLNLLLLNEEDPRVLAALEDALDSLKE